jgi:type II secretory pathway component GspD/PulD (secretin)
MSNQQQRWFDCDTKPGLGKAPGGSYGVPVGGTAGDQTLYLEPLPSPCNSKKPPKMASIDAVLIRTVDTQNSSYGINLLTGLTMFAGSQSFRSTGSVGGSSVSGVVQNSVIGIGNATSATLNSVSGLVSYSLNIANSTSSNSQVIARPTLTALDRIPSTFYSGAVITAGLNGGGVSGAQITNIPTGVSLSVTPTFVDEESMMLAVKVSRSYVTGTSANLGGFSASISQDQHAVTANVKIKYGETLILDGLSSRVSAGGQDGVPVLQDIPIIQYFFNQKTQQQYSENVVVLVTPRKVQTEEEISRAAANAGKDQPLTNKEKIVYRALNLYKQITTESDTNLDNTLLALDRDSNYFRTFASSALNRNMDSWVSEPKIDKFFNDAANMIYFTR